MSSSANAASDKLKILCIHGYRQNAQIFRERTGALRKIIKKYTELVFISAPNKVQPAEGEEDLDQRGWWFSTTDHTFKASQACEVDPGLQESLTTVAEAFKELGPFDGVLAFSQGAAFAAILCALQSQGDTRFPFKFAVLVASFRSLSSSHAAFYANPIDCPTLHVFGDTDGVIPKESSEGLLPLFVNPQVLNHPGGHFVPASSPQKKVYLDFLEHWYKKKQEENSISK
ncbi:esterase OVCA2-like isoform X2 [Patiria miniata]|uniref:Serine hydrolase domain-containing protein n=1 Tax=Patiria miniata TaxID=46514 RepID=A0A913ZD24_PATMI|nr:esterase OVCA2-like isoform X1 [Patiria miniata]XP_038049419.1 esterase OVCA2-like isoform X2 [Patiria miniata]